MAAHENAGKSDEWYTPGYVFAAMGVTFNMDVASPEEDCPADAWCERAIFGDSLSKPWSGFVWMNPPFGKRNGLEPWLTKFFDHGNGVALTPDRTSAPWWQAASDRTDLLLFCSPKIHFIPGPGVKASSPGTGTTLWAIGPQGCEALRNYERAGLGRLHMPIRRAEAA